MRFIDAGDFTSDRPWGALDIAEIQDATGTAYSSPRAFRDR